MAIRYSLYEVLKIAVQVEKDGYRFYTKAAAISKNNKVSSLFQYLAHEEEKHQKTFETMLSETSHTQIAEGEAGSVDFYLKALADVTIFRQRDVFENLTLKTFSDTDGLKVGIQAEKDSILYYTEIRRFLPEKEQPLLDRVINEEKDHLLQLTNLYKTLI